MAILLSFAYIFSFYSAGITVAPEKPLEEKGGEIEFLNDIQLEQFAKLPQFD
ncbi:MAG: hypothetical protein Fur0021_27930 [Candidatus Promineifilaceae bacterium]